METLQIRTLGSFTLQWGDKVVSDRDNRSKKIWLLLAYLLWQKGRPVTGKELIHLFWDDESTTNPESALKITFHRTRNLLDKLWSSAGHQLIVRRETGYAWNIDIPMELDTDTFDRLYDRPRGEGRLEALLTALSLYQGDFLEKLSSEPWVIPIITHYHNQYVQAVLEAAPLLAAANRHREAAALCREAITREPYDEGLYRRLMEALAATGDYKGANLVYEDLCRVLFDDFGIQPSEETRATWRAATQTLSDRALSMDTILEQLQETNVATGALLCDYEDFKILCHVEARAMQRSGKATHVALIAVTGTPEKTLSKRSQDRIMEQMGEEIRMNLRRGDTFARCSLTQYILMLPQANYENSCMVCRRVIGAFNRRHPHSAVRIQFMVQPLTPHIATP